MDVAKQVESIGAQINEIAKDGKITPNEYYSVIKVAAAIAAVLAAVGAVWRPMIFSCCSACLTH
jgi:hypothetical protein